MFQSKKKKIIGITNNNYRDIFPVVHNPDGSHRIRYIMPAMIICAKMEGINMFDSPDHMQLVRDMVMRYAREN